MKILLASAASRFREQLGELLRGQGYEPLTLESPERALDSIRELRPQLVVVAEPFFGDKLTAFLASLRRDGALAEVPVLCVAPAGGAEEAISCLDAGADDFIHKPFNAQIFLARARTLLRRRVWLGAAPEESVTVVKCGPLTIKLLTRQATLSGEALCLTRLEFELLAFLAAHPDRVYKRDELLAAVWNYPGNVETRTLDKHVESLRRKLGASSRLIETVHGVGYRFGSAARSRA